MNGMKKITGIISVFILLSILIVFNTVVKPMRVRMDVTEDKLYTLSDGTKTLLKDLDRDVTVKFYFSKSNERVPNNMKNFASRIRDLLKEYESRSKRYLVVEEYDPQPDSDEEEWAQRYGLQAQSLDMFGVSGNLFLGIVAVSGNKESVIPMVSFRDEPRLEYMVTRMISEVTTEEKPKIGIMSALPVNGGGAGNPMMRQRPQKWAFVSELSRQYDVQDIQLTNTEIPKDINTLIVLHPADISDEMLYAIDQFVLRGGNLLAFMDPYSIAAEQSANPQMQQYGMQPPQTASNLNKLTEAWGVKLIDGKLVADETSATLINAGGGRAQRNAAFLSIRSDNVNQTEIATESISDMIVPFAGAFEVNATNDITMTELLFTTEDGFLTDATSIRTGSIRSGSETKRYPFALRLTGKFKTAFPEGITSQDDQEETKEEPTGLKESAEPGVVVLVADVDFLSDPIATQSVNFFGQTMVQPRNENLSFAANIVEQLCGSEVLIGLRSRNAFNRPFDKVIELEKVAAEKWQQEEERLNKQLQETEARINSLQAQRNDGSQQFLTPEQEAEIKKFREEQFNTQQNLKEVRKELRKDIETLGMKVKMLNILAVPLLVACFGITRGIRLKKTR